MMNLPKSSQIIMGIDFGSTISRCCFLKNGELHTLPPIPSYVGFDNNAGKLIVGREAQRKYHLDRQSHVVYNLKQAILKDERFALGPDTFLAVSLVSQLLRQMKQNVESMTGSIITRAIMTVPSFFSELHKGALKDAAMLTGIVDVQLISEPTAALMYYQNILLKL